MNRYVFLTYLNPKGSGRQGTVYNNLTNYSSTLYQLTLKDGRKRQAPIALRNEDS